MGAKLELKGLRFGMLRVIGRHISEKAGKPRWDCVCDCGGRSVVRTDNLMIGNSTSCGCKNLEGLKIGQTFGRGAKRGMTV